MPARIGTTGVTIACAGIEPTKDLRGKRFGRKPTKSYVSSNCR